jgi:hypothetical protein
MKIKTTVRNAQLNALTARLDNGYLRIYSGTKPADADAALAGNTLLAELRFGATAFAAASGGAATANAISADTSANATGTASFVRLFESDGSTVVADLTVGTSGADLNLNSLSISSGIQVQVTSFVLTQPDGV